jgi:uncharacterized damage-inducible protein DinB
MHDPAYFRLMAEYNSWMNGRLYELCAGLSDAERRCDRGAFFKSIHGTLDHLLYGDLAWMSRFTGSPPEPPPLGVEICPDFEELRRARRRLDTEIRAWAASLRRDWLEAPFTYTSKVDGQTRTLPAWVLVVHMFNHQTHHRGQLTTLLMQAGLDPGVTDLPWLPSLSATHTFPDRS